jgi:hypothetical protein
MKKNAKKVKSSRTPRVRNKSRNRPTKRVLADKGKADFIGRLKGVFQIVGDIESAVAADEWECCREDYVGANQASNRGLNAKSVDVLDQQTIDPLEFPVGAKKRGRGRPRHTN